MSAQQRFNATRDAPRIGEIRTRGDLRRAQRVVIKAGTSTVVDVTEGYPSFHRIGRIAEEICRLRRQGVEVLFVCSGSQGVGRNVLRRLSVLTSSALDRLHSNATEDSQHVPAAAASAGQLALMNIWQTIFSQLDITVSEVLLTKHDFESDDRKMNLQATLESLLAHGVVPIINENDAVTAGVNMKPAIFRDNDGLSALVASQLHADLLILLTDVAGVYTGPPSDPRSRIMKTFDPSVNITFGDKSSVGRGGMEAKIQGALRALQYGVPAVVIANGSAENTLQQVIIGENVGTLFVEDPSGLLASEAVSDTTLVAQKQAKLAREGSRALISLSTDDRVLILCAVANALDENRRDILEANEQDMDRARVQGLAPPLMKRLQLTNEKIDILVTGIRAIANAPEPINNVVAAMELSADVVVEKVKVPIGVLLVIFESRPDSLAQIAALALRSGNGLLLKGGREAEKSNSKLHAVITHAIVSGSGGRVSADVIGLITTRSDVDKLLKLDKEIDLVIPRGSNAMVKKIQSSTSIPVLGHADGVCHLFVHRSADMNLAKKILIDSKLNYPAACNAAETLLVDHDIPTHAILDLIGDGSKAGIRFLLGPRAREILNGKLLNIGELPTVEDFHTEYGDNRMALEIVSDTSCAIDHINEHSSHHTEAIVVADSHCDGEVFLRAVDSACVFRNTSTRMADGFRLGLGAEVGISTSRIHARGPVGVEGLLCEKWVVRGSNGAVATAEAYATGESIFTHKTL
jgi:delta-1-pyrroline-5-carboxylate synthetase